MTERWRERLGTLDTIEPSHDLWQRATTHSTKTFPDLPPERGHRVVTVIVAVALAATGLAAVSLAFGRGSHIQAHSPSPAPTGGGSMTYRDPTGTWEITLPRGFRAASTVPTDGLAAQGVWIANVPIGTEGPPDSLPTRAVVVLITYGPTGPVMLAPIVQPDSTFPINFAGLKVVPGPGHILERTVIANGQKYWLEVRTGLDAGPRAARVAKDILASLRFLPLTTGTSTGSLYVLGSAHDYPVGSVTRFEQSALAKTDHASPAPFYLVHTRRGFYALAASYDHRGYIKCPITYDSLNREFICQNVPNGPTWTLHGSPLPNLLYNAVRRGRFPLRPLLTRISLDGHVLVAGVTVPLRTDLRLTRGA